VELFWDGLYILPFQAISSVIVRKQKVIVTVPQKAIPEQDTTDFITNKNIKTMDNINVLPIFNSILYSFLGIAILLVCYFIIEKLTPEKTWHEIAQNKNIALAIVFGAFIIGISMIISAAIHG
jgi:putative membrane protein